MKNVFFAFMSLGMLIGLLTGLANSTITSTVIAAILTFFGGSIAFFINQEPSKIKIYSVAIIAFSLSSLCGVIGGVFLKENKLLTMTSRIEELSKLAGIESPSFARELLSRDYLKSRNFNKTNSINVKYRAGDIDAKQAYESLWNEINKLEPGSN